MSDPDVRPAAGRSGEERAAFFQELMREEKRLNPPPMSGLAVGALGAGLACWVGSLISWLVALIWAGTALVFAVAALAQIWHRERRGLPFVIAAFAVLVAWAVAVNVPLTR